jgi:phosphatidylglycerol:prolipoprotein diacylglycerol transferase
MTLAAWLHTLSPIIVRFTDAFAVRWYGVAYLAGFALGYAVLLRLARRRLVLIPYERVGDAVMWLILGVLVGGRLGYVTFYDPSAWITFTKSFPFWEVFAIHHGGMASHGGIAGVMAAAYRISRGWKDPETGQTVGRCPPLHVMDIAALICPFGLFFGRLANFVNGELLGRIVAPPGTPGPAWAVQYPQELKGIRAISPSGEVAISEHAQPLTLEQGRELYSLLQQVGAPGDTLSRRISLLIEHAKDFAPQLKGLLASRHPSQLYQAAAEGLVLGGLLWIIWAKPRKPGVIGVWFLIGYGVLRILTEFIRLPDPQFVHGRYAGLSRGQWLSVAMIVGGFGLLALIRKWGGPALGGWARPAPQGAKT